MAKKGPLFFVVALSILITGVSEAADANLPEHYFGQPIFDASQRLQYVAENNLRTHSQDEYVMIRVQNIKIHSHEKGRVMVALWDSSETYARADVLPFRHSFHWAKDAINGELVFKIGGLTPGKQYSFFAHFDKNSDGQMNTNKLGIPNEPYVFSNASNQGQGRGLTRDKLSAPKYKNTLVTYVHPGQEILLPF